MKREINEKLAPLNWAILKKLARLPIGLGVISRKQIANYDEYLSSKSWAIKRKLILTMWGWRCALCDSSTGLEVHHRTYKNLGDERWLDLIPLCDACHHHHHEGRGHGDTVIKRFGNEADKLGGWW